MKRKISSSDIQKRIAIRNEGFTLAKPDIDCENAYLVAKRNNNTYTIRKFFQECAKSKSSAEQYITDCLEFASKENNKELNTYLENYILPKVDNFTITNEMQNNYSDNIKSMLKEQIEYNRVCDRIIDNSNQIDLDSLSEDVEDPKALLMNICEAVDNFDLPGYGKVQVAIEESSYLFDKKHIHDNPLDRVNTIQEYFYLNNSIADEDKYNIKVVIENSAVLDDDTISSAIRPTNGISTTAKINYNGSIETVEDPMSKLIKHYISDDRSRVNLDLIIKYAENSNTSNAKSNFEQLFKLFYNIVSMGNDSTLKDYICINISALYEAIVLDKIGNPDTCEIANILYDVLSEFSDKIEDGDPDDLCAFKCAINDLKIKLENVNKILYPKYNIESMVDSPLSEYVSPISIDEYQENYFGDYCSAIKASAKLIHEAMEKFLFKEDYSIEKGYDTYLSRLDEDVNILEADVIDPNTNTVDSLITDYNYNGYSNGELQDFLCKIAKSINENCLDKIDSSFKCYYTLTETSIDFYLRDNRPLNIPEEDRVNLFESNLTESDYDNAAKIVAAANYVSDDMNIKENAIKYFSERPDSDMFETFTEAASLVGFSRDTMQDIYDSIKENSTNESLFTARNSYLMNSYYPIECEPEIALEAFAALQEVVKTSDIHDSDYVRLHNDIDHKLKAYGYNGEDDKKATQTKQPSAVDKAITQSQQQTHELPEEKENPDDYKDVTKNGPLKNLAPQNIKLFVKGLFNRIGDKSNKAQQTERNMNAAMNMFGKSVRKALISDRREAIIKGQVIPSFSKCVKIAIVLCGLGVAAGFGGKAIANHGGRALMKSAEALRNSGEAMKAGKEATKVLRKANRVAARGARLTGNGGKAIGVITGILTPVLTGYAALCQSKKLTRRERALLLDDIAVELQVIEKEIQMADASNQINKYRALLRLQKDLQRQYNRIKYNIRVGEGDVVPARNADLDYD